MAPQSLAEPDSVPATVERYSAIARMWLLVGDRSHPVAQAAPEFVILARASQISSGPATLVVQINGNEDRAELQVLGPDESYPERLRISRR